MPAYNPVGRNAKRFRLPRPSAKSSNSKTLLFVNKKKQKNFIHCHNTFPLPLVGRAGVGGNHTNILH
jgi:hypothetical protein